MEISSIIGLAFFFGLVVWVVIFVLWYRHKVAINSAGQRIMDSVFLEILMPKDSVDDEDRRNRSSGENGEHGAIGVAEQLYATLSEVRLNTSFNPFKPRESISFEIISINKIISFYIVCPETVRDLIEKQIHAQYPDAHIEEVMPPELINESGHTLAVELGLKKGFYYPVKTYKHMESDPLSALTNSLSKLSSVEAGSIQMVIAPAKGQWRSKINQKARKIQKGEQIDTESSLAGKVAEMISKGISSFFTSLFDAQSKKKNQEGMFSDKNGEDQIQKQLTPMQQEAVKRLEEKTSKTGFETNLRILIRGKNQISAESHMRNVLSSFMQYSQEPFNGFQVLRKNKGKILRDFLYRRFVSGWYSKQILNTEELASIYHLPDDQLETPNVKWLGSKRAPAPVNLPDKGVLLGVNTYRGVESEVRIDTNDRRRHMYIIGRTGTGKSELMKSMARQDVQNGEGIAVIDPHGDFVEDLLRFIPKERADDVILFEPFDTKRPMGLNMLEVKNDEEKDFAVQEMIAIFYKLFPPEMIGPMFEHNMRNVMLTLMANPREPGTVAEIPRMFTDPEYQKYRLTFVKDPVVRNFWEQEMAKTSDFHKSEMLGYLISKVGRFVENEMIRNIIGQSHSAFDFRQVMDEGKILLINLSKGKTGEVNSKLLGLIIVSKLQMAALSRADLPEESRKDFYLYIDEFQNFVTDSIATILSEARKYRLDMIMAHQYISQLVAEKNDTTVRDAVFGNAGSMVAFRVGVEDAEVVAKEFKPTFNEYDVINIDKFNAYVKLMIDGTASRPFNIRTLAPSSSGSEEIAKAVRELSRLKYGRPQDEVEQSIIKRSKIGDLLT